MTSRHFFRAEGLQVAIVVVGFMGCANLVQAEVISIVRKQTDTVVLHSIGGPRCEGQVRKFAKVGGDAKFWAQYLSQQPNIGAHYVIDRKGAMEISTPEDRIAYHAGPYNAHSIGIELVNNGDGTDPYPKAQIDRLVLLLKDIRQRYNISGDHIITHQTADKGRKLEPCGGLRKVDPGANFPFDDVVTRSTPD